MKTWIAVSAALVLLLALGTAACAETQETAGVAEPLPKKSSDAAVVQIPDFPVTSEMPVETPAPTEAPEPEDTPDPTPEPTPMPDPAKIRRSSTTGLTLYDAASYRPVLVAIRNDADARPQTALMQADVVYEFAVEAMDTGFLAVFADGCPDVAGPVDSARCYTVALQKEWKSLFAYNGYPPETLPGYPGIKRGDISIEINVLERPGYFEEDGKWKLAKVSQMVKERFAERTITEQNRFSFLADISYLEGEEFLRVGIPFMCNDTGKVEFYYDSGTNRLFRYEDGKPTMTRTPNADGDGYLLEDLHVQNLIVQYCAYGFYENGYHRSLHLTGKGRCDYFVNGRHVEGTWERSSESQYTRYLLSDGTPLLLQPGSTWIVLQNMEKEVFIGF